MIANFHSIPLIFYRQGHVKDDCYSSNHPNNHNRAASAKQLNGNHSNQAAAMTRHRKSGCGGDQSHSNGGDDDLDILSQGQCPNKGQSSKLQSAQRIKQQLFSSERYHSNAIDEGDGAEYLLFY